MGTNEKEWKTNGTFKKISANFCVKNLEMIENELFMNFFHNLKKDYKKTRRGRPR